MHTAVITDTKIHWGRVLLSAFLLEVVLFAVLVPIGQIFGTTVFFIAVPIGCFVFGFLFGIWVARKLSSQFALHGTLVGIFATLLYFGLAAASPGGIPAAVAVYGLALFLFSHAARIAGCVAGALFKGMRTRATS